MTNNRINTISTNDEIYSKIFYTDSNGNPCKENDAEMCIIQECNSSGNIIFETIGFCKQTKKD